MRLAPFVGAAGVACTLLCCLQVPFEHDRCFFLFPKAKRAFLSIMPLEPVVAALCDDRADYVQTPHNYSCYSQATFKGRSFILKHFEETLWEETRHLDALLMSVLPDAPSFKMGDEPLLRFHCKPVKEIKTPITRGFIKASGSAYRKTGPTGLVSTLSIGGGS